MHYLGQRRSALEQGLARFASAAELAVYTDDHVCRLLDRMNALINGSDLPSAVVYWLMRREIALDVLADAYQALRIYIPGYQLARVPNLISDRAPRLIQIILDHAGREDIRPEVLINLLRRELGFTEIIAKPHICTRIKVRGRLADLLASRLTIEPTPDFVSVSPIVITSPEPVREPVPV